MIRHPIRDRTTKLVAAIVLVMLATACGNDGGDPPACDNPRTTTSVTMGDFFYEPTCVQASPGGELEVVNEGQAPHTFTVETETVDVEADVPAGERATLSVPDFEAGTYRVTCTYHPQMEAALRIT
jgi:plastocyanin